jgi:hypothetical protein
MDASCLVRYPGLSTNPLFLLRSGAQTTIEHSLTLQISQEDIPAFVACLSIGTLYAIREGIIPPQVGIWTLGPPRMWEPLEAMSLIPREIIEVLQRCDELSAIQQLMPDRFVPYVDELIARLQLVLAQAGDPAWDVRWVRNSEP